ncbi:MAG: hypothetical protein ACXWNL_16105 [Vulcanimicrobiaceae bacterium]
MYLQFLDLYGNPVYVRPERVDALRGVSTLWEGKPRAATLIVMTNRETFRVRGLVDVVHDAIVAWHKERTPAVIADCPNRADGSPMVCKAEPYRSLVEGSI